MYIYFFSALAERARKRHRIFAEPRLAELGSTTAIPRLVPTMWRVLRNHWRAFRLAVLAKVQK